MRVDEVLDGAADALDEYGWGQGKWRNPDTGCMCLDGAISFVITGEPRKTTDLELEALGLLRVYLEKRGVIDMGPVAWNDYEGRTKEEVTALLREVAAHVRVGLSAPAAGDEL